MSYKEFSFSSHSWHKSFLHYIGHFINFLNVFQIFSNRSLGHLHWTFFSWEQNEETTETTEKKATKIGEDHKEIRGKNCRTLIVTTASSEEESAEDVSVQNEGEERLPDSHPQRVLHTVQYLRKSSLAKLLSQYKLDHRRHAVHCNLVTKRHKSLLTFRCNFLTIRGYPLLVPKLCKNAEDWCVP